MDQEPEYILVNDLNKGDIQDNTIEFINYDTQTRIVPHNLQLLSKSDQDVAKTVLAALINFHHKKNEYPQEMAIETFKEEGFYRCIIYGIMRQITGPELIKLEKTHRLVRSAYYDPETVYKKGSTMYSGGVCVDIVTMSTHVQSIDSPVVVNTHSAHVNSNLNTNANRDKNKDNEPSGFVSRIFSSFVGKRHRANE